MHGRWNLTKIKRETLALVSFPEVFQPEDLKDIVLVAAHLAGRFASLTRLGLKQTTKESFDEILGAKHLGLARTDVFSTSTIDRLNDENGTRLT